MRIPTYRVGVVRAQSLTPRMRRVTLGGPTLAQFESSGLPDERRAGLGARAARRPADRDRPRRAPHRHGAGPAARPLARLVLSDPPIAVLDEATAEAGSAGARILETAAARAVQGRTALIVAHRLTQAVSADRVVVIHAGRVRETGTHNELVAAGGAYAELWAAWTSSRTVNTATSDVSS